MPPADHHLLPTDWPLPTACPPMLPWSVTDSRLPIWDRPRTPGHALQFCPSSGRKHRHNTGPQGAMLAENSGALKGQRGPAASPILWARHLRTILEHLRKSTRRSALRGLTTNMETVSSSSRSRWCVDWYSSLSAAAESWASSSCGASISFCCMAA